MYHYNDNEVGERFRGERISEKNVEKAREAYKNHHTEMDEFQSKILATKRQGDSKGAPDSPLYYENQICLVLTAYFYPKKYTLTPNLIVISLLW